MSTWKTLEAEISDRFHIPSPTLLSSVGKSPPLVFSHLHSDTPVPERSKAPRPEDGYVVHVLLGERADVQMWLNGRDVNLPPLQRGGFMLGHLEATPMAAYNSKFDFVRFYANKATLDELADGAELQRFGGLRRPEHGTLDPILFHLASAIAPLIRQGDPGDQLLLDHLAIAFATRLMSAYDGAPVDIRPSQCRLATWQERRAKEFIDANLGRSVSLLEVAETCGLSISHFSRAFRNTTGRPPHRWLLERRVEAAKGLLVRGDMPLAQIAAVCGFSDPSHFSRVFLKVSGESPAAWRRSNRR
jgi:AraC family transcriptional regulator